jgi:hypothetical protein
MPSSCPIAIISNTCRQRKLKCTALYHPESIGMLTASDQVPKNSPCVASATSLAGTVTGRKGLPSLVSSSRLLLLPAHGDHLAKSQSQHQCVMAPSR